MREYQFDCVFYYVSDLDRAIAFYTSAFGFRLVSRDVVARFLVDGVLFELVPTSDPQLLSGRGNARLVLTVPHLGTAIQELRAKGLEVSDATAVVNGQLATLRDSEGNEIILWEYAERPDQSTLVAWKDPGTGR